MHLNRALKMYYIGSLFDLSNGPSDPIGLPRGPGMVGGHPNHR